MKEESEGAILEENKKKAKKSGLKNVGFFLICAVIGMTLGIVSATLVPNMPADVDFYAIAITVFCFFIGYLLHVPIHEAGHLVFGLLTGYEFVSFRVGSLTIYKKDGRYKKANFTFPGTGGQCLMNPPEYNDGKFPSFLYNIGGVAMNLAVSALALLAISETVSMWGNLFLVGFALAGLFTAVVNGMPRKINGFPTDGYNIVTMRKDEVANWAFWIQLRANALLTQGERPKDLPVEPFLLNAQDDLANPMNTSAYMLRYNHYLDQKEFDKARQVLAKVTPFMDKMMPLHRNEINVEKVFLELIGDNDPAVIQELYNEELIQHVQATHNWMNKKRLAMAYEWFQRRDADKAMESYRELVDMAERYPLQGEAEMERMLAEWLKDQIH